MGGEVNWHYQSQFAEQNVRRLQGVVVIINKITFTPRDNIGNVASDIEYALHRSLYEPKTITVRADGSKVVLAGTVHS